MLQTVTKLKNYVGVITIIHKTVLILSAILWFYCNNGIAQSEENGEAVLKTVVIDAGHGGKDPGCIGRFLKEKDVALNLSLRLGEYIKEKYPSIKVIYTRDRDVFLELDQRARIANENNADLFISIHANAASSKAYGTETFVLGLHRSESQQKVAERENSIIHFEEDSEEKYKDFDLSPDAIIARQIQLSVYLDLSIQLAARIQEQFTSIGRKDRGVKQAGFIVLYKTTMPSILIEAGFLTNSEEEKFLKDPFNQLQMANGIFRAFQQYKIDLEGSSESVTDAESFIKAARKSGKLPEDKEEMVAEKSFAEIAQEKLREKENESKAVTDSDLIFRIQIETSRTAIPLNSRIFQGLHIMEYVENNLYKYTTGEFVNDIDAARELRLELKEKGFEHAFIVAFQGGERIPITDALQILSSINN